MRAEIERLLREAIGLHAETVGASVVGYALKQRMAACGLADAEDYVRLVQSSRAELQELVNAVVIPETWFFRDREAFAAMARHARAARRPGFPIRMLSLPCSTGEEPYSMAMAMLDAGFAAADFTIDAVDVSTRNIAQAERAIYGRNSFRGTDIAFRARYFEAVEGGYRPMEAVTRQVRFRAGNLFDAALAAPESQDVVFCRNLLIYFDRELQQRALERLRQLLVADGMLLVGPGESSLPTLFGFVSARQPMAFAFLKQDVAAAPNSPSPPPERIQRQARQPSRRPAPGARGTPPLRPNPAPAPAAIVETSVEEAAKLSLEAIESAANAGRLNEARQAANAHMERFGPSAAVFYLLGLAQDAAESPGEAIESYRKALYLAPDHREALAHLALLLQRRGDASGARALRERLGRIETRSGAR